MSKIRVSIIEDNKVIRDNVSKFISFHDDFEIAAVHGSAKTFLGSLQIGGVQTDILLLDIGLPGISGLEAIPLILEKMPDLNIVMLTTYEEEDVIVKALCSGACKVPAIKKAVS
ncbi:MAG: response regulator transcription factor [Chitinophagaceae bacterium]|nr:response regulator transcription factor [Chitinophagaceae bacterium]